MDYNILTNNELKTEYSKNEDKFNEAKKIFTEQYNIMMECSENANKIKEILNKREGKK